MTLRPIPFRSPDDAGGAGTDPKAPVPYERFAEVNTRMQAAETAAGAAAAEAKAAREEAATAKAGAETWATERTTFETTLAETTRRLGLAKSGVLDDDHAEALGGAYKAIPEAERPKSEGELWADILAGKRQAPRTLIGFMPAPGTVAAARVVIPPPPGAAGQGESAAPAMSAEKLAELNAAWRARPTDPAARKAAQEAAATLRALQSRK